jgi:hypothetical protein
MQNTKKLFISFVYFKKLLLTIIIKSDEEFSSFEEEFEEAPEELPPKASLFLSA